MMLIPKSGRLLKKRGSKAQWIAQTSEAPIPKLSQLILNFMGIKDIKKQHCCKIINRSDTQTKPDTF